LALAVGVGGEVDRARGARLVLQALQDLALLLGHDVLRPEVVLDVQPELALRQVAHVPQAGAHGVVAPEKALDGARLRRRLDNHQVFCHEVVPPREIRARRTSTLQSVISGGTPPPGREGGAWGTPPMPPAGERPCTPGINSSSRS